MLPITLHTYAVVFAVKLKQCFRHTGLHVEFADLVYVSTSCLVVVQGLDAQHEGTSALGRLKYCATNANLIELRPQ